MRTLVCPKCGASYEQHPLNPTAHPLCPACRNKVSWDNIRKELASAARQTATSGIFALSANAGDSAPVALGASSRSPLSAHNETHRPATARSNPFGSKRSPQYIPASKSLWGAEDGQAFLAGRIDLGSISRQSVFKLTKPQDSAASLSEPELAPLAETSQQAKEPAKIAASAFIMPSFNSLIAVKTPENDYSGPKFDFNAMPLAETSQQAQLTASLGLPAPKPGMIEMPNTCGG